MDKRLLGCFFGRKLLIPIFEIFFPQSLHLFQCGIQNNVVGEKINIAFAVTHHQNQSQE